MSVLIRGMEMPKSCHACCFFGQADIWESDFDGYTKSFCKRTGSQTYDYVDKFLPNCPLVPVPKHGRLGDLNALAQQIEHERFHHTHTDSLAARHHVAEYGHFLKAIIDAPTIIPASEEGET